MRVSKLCKLRLWVGCWAAWLMVGPLTAQEPTLAPPVLRVPQTETLPQGKTGVRELQPQLQLPAGTQFPSGTQFPPGTTIIGPEGLPGAKPVLIESAGDQLPFQQAPGILILPVNPRKNGGYSAEGGGWKMYESPRGMQVVPAAGEKIVAFTSVGPEVTEVVCFSGPRGDFHRHGIPRCSGPVVPVVTETLAWYQLPDRICAYSAVTNSWGDLNFREPPEVSHANGLLVAVADRRVHCFSEKTGRWESVDINQP